MIKNYFSFLLLLFIVGCNTSKKAYINPNETNQVEATLPDGELFETLYLIGDVGEKDILDTETNYLFKHLSKNLANENENSAIAFLGDNVYPKGLPKKDDKQREEAEAILDAQLNLVKDFKGKVYYIPGNHDWNHMSAGGLKAVKRQEDYIQDFEGKEIKFYPNDGCGDPKVKKIDKDLYYVFIDTQWWLQNWDKEKKINKGCSIKSRQEFLQQLEWIFLEHKNDQIVVFMHHPFYSNGEHGGFFSAKTHLFPLTDFKKNAWVPLPVLGSLMPIFRGVGGAKQDIPNPLYQKLVDEVQGMLIQNKHVIFVSGHDHNLQYFQSLQGHQFIISGSGSKTDYAKRGGDANMAHAVIGYSKLYFYKNREIWMDFIRVDAAHPTGELFFRKQIVQPKPGTVETALNYPDGNTLKKDTTFAANPNFAAKPFKRFLMGGHYRDAWTTPVKAEIVNFDTEKGGIVPVKKGGGMASNSLRVQAPNGNQYALRSIIKDYTKIFGPQLADLKAINIMADQNSASHPYAPLVLPKLSQAANIYYTEPKLVFLKKQQGLGKYNELFNEEFYLLEDRPAGDRHEDANLGRSEDIISYLDLLSMKLEDNKTKVDEKWTLRSRLFDLWIHDWDRHDDQWRWAKVTIHGEEIYRPIPRDRDQAFYKFEGVLPSLAAGLVIRKFKTFKSDIKDVTQQSFNARYFDRYFLHELEWEDWEKQIVFLQTYLTDDVIDEAMKELPPEVYQLDQEEISSKLKSRRDGLYEAAKKLYNYLSSYVSIPGSNEDELFEVHRNEDGSVKVAVYDLSKKGNKKEKLYERTFYKNETKEIRLYGLGGKDDFVITGKTKRSIKVRVIGGFGKDEVEDNSKVIGLRKMTKVYDETDGIEIEKENEVRDLTGPSIAKNEYEREDHLYDRHAFAPILGYTPDDKFWLGVGLTSTIHGFRKEPYKSKHILKASFSPSSRTAFHASYVGDFTKALFNYLDVQPGFQLDNPFYVNYFGLGNLTEKTSDNIRFNWVRLRQYQANVYLKKSWVNNRFFLYAGPKFSSWSVKNVEGRVLDNPAFAVSDDELKSNSYLGGVLGLAIDSRDNKVFPRNGIMTDIQASVFDNLNAKEKYGTVKAEQTMYVTFGSRFATTFASRTGWSMAQGDLNFYHYPAIGNNTYLRGFRNDRFRGSHILYQNIDLRVKLAKLEKPDSTYGIWTFRRL